MIGDCRITYIASAYHVEYARNLLAVLIISQSRRASRGRSEVILRNIRNWTDKQIHMLSGMLEYGAIQISGYLKSYSLDR